MLLAPTLGCGRGTPAHTRNSFYYWRSTFVLSAADSVRLRELEVERLYVRFFDVDLGPAPKGDIRFMSNIPAGIEIVPTVFIAERAIRGLTPHDADELAMKIAAHINTMASAAGIPVHEIQIDCDWNTTTRETYFRILRALNPDEKGKLPGYMRGWTVSATIRLHQIRYYRAQGVPPVSRGMLMAYNIGPPTDMSIDNSIFNGGEVGKYISDIDHYPLRLDVALPVFSWGVAFRYGSFLVLLNNLRARDLDTNSAYEKIDATHFRARRENIVNSEQLKTGDIIRTEEVTMPECMEIARALREKIDRDSMNIALFHYDPRITGNYRDHELENLFGVFH
ncbi:MAG: hypothetical protein JWQ98_1579 [Chlorobi bacterium]|nr:hypothetical protein [Chlorobiota bacterium]